jgi:hypothetical protein
VAFRLKAGKSVSKGVKRIARRQMDKALDLLRSKGGGDESVHDARKAFKRVRSVLRLVRDEIGEKTYRRENRRFRDGARPPTEVRDAKVLVEALEIDPGSRVPMVRAPGAMGSAFSIVPSDSWLCVTDRLAARRQRRGAA